MPMGSERFTQLVDAHYASLYRFALSLARNSADAGDLLQQTFFIWATKGHGLLTQIVLPGPRIHPNPMYYGRIGAFMIGEGAAVAVGAARGALDLFEEILRTKKQTQNPALELYKDPEFLAYYGKAALQDLYKRMSGKEEEPEQEKAEGMVKGPGNGMDDMVTHMAQGGQKVLLSNDEFIIPADVVSGLGDGSSEAGARKLYAMMDRVRMERTGTKKQPGKVKDSRVLPA